MSRRATARRSRINGDEDEITGKSAPGSKFTQLKIGMPMKQVADLIGPPNDQGSYVTGKAFISFFFGGDRYRYEMAYKGQGRLVFAQVDGFRRQPDQDHPCASADPPAWCGGLLLWREGPTMDALLTNAAVLPVVFDPVSPRCQPGWRRHAWRALWMLGDVRQGATKLQPLCQCDLRQPPSVSQIALRDWHCAHARRGCAGPIPHP